MANKNFVDYINSLREIQSNVLTLNEEAEEKQQPQQNNEDGGDQEADLNDLDGLLNGTGNADEGEQNPKQGGGDQDINAEAGNLEGEEESAPEGLEDIGAAEDVGAEEAPKDTYETDTEGLVNAISKLTKSGHSVKIVLRRLAA